MQNNLIKTSVLTFILLFCLSVEAFAELDFGGFLEIDQRVKTEPDGKFSWNRAVLGIRTDLEISDSISAHSELKLKNIGFSYADKTNFAPSISKTHDNEIEIYELYLNSYGFVWENLDLRIGKQRIAWGRADKLNQIDNINPHDFSDMLKIGEKSPSTAVKLTSYFGETSLTGVYVPEFAPAILPDSYFSMFTDPIDRIIEETLPSLTLNIDVQTKFPPATKTNSMYGIKIDRNIFDLDMSLSYFRGFDSVPNISSAIMTAEGSDATIYATLTYPEIHVAGFDIAGDFYGMGFWGEIAHFRPIDTFQEVASPDLSLALTQEVQDYVKYTLGCDYKFETGLYVNAQFVHGFFDDRGALPTDIIIKELDLDAESTVLSDLIFVQADQKFFNNKIKLVMIVGAEFDKKNAEETFKGQIFNPELIYYPADAAEIVLGFLSLDGEDFSKFGLMKNIDQAYFKLKYSF